MATMTDTIQKYKLVINDLYNFYQYFVINHFNKEVVPAPHIETLSRELMRMYRGDYRKLTVSMPPRHSKSSLITLAFPLWLICRDPTLNIMVINSTFTLSESFGIRIRELFHQYGEVLGLRVSDQKHASGWIMFEDLDGNLTGGSIRLIGIGGQITGFDADWVIVDDLVKGVQDTTPTVLDKTKDFFNGIVMQRVEPDTRLIVLGTIWHSEDILSYIRKEQADEYKIIDMPAYDQYDNVLWSERYDLDFFHTREKEMGERLFQALYMCHPLDATGSFFNLDKVIFGKYHGLLSNSKSTVRSWDFAYSNEEKGEVNDYTAGIRMTRTVDDMYLVHDLVYGQFGEELINVVKSTARLDTPNIPILLETGTKGGASKFLFESYKQMYLKGFRVQQSEPLGSKVDRASPLRDAILDGKIIIDLPDEEREQVIRQLQSFPLHKRDGIIDALSYAYNFLSQGSSADTIATAGKRKRRSLT